MQPKLTFISILLICVFCANAQLKKGNRLVGLTVATGLWSGNETEFTAPNAPSSTVETRSFSLQLTPSLGWFLTDQSIVGASVTIGMSDEVSRQKSGGVTFIENNYNNVDFSAGGYFRYYFNSTSSLRPFTHIFLSAGSGSTNTDGFQYYTGSTGTVRSTYDGRSSGRFYYNTGINAGLTKLISANSGLDFYIGYLRTYNKGTNKTEQFDDYSDPGTPDARSNYENTRKNTGNAITFGVGFQVFLNKK
jgi:hypothetical protein